MKTDNGLPFSISENVFNLAISSHNGGKQGHGKASQCHKYAALSQLVGNTNAIECGASPIGAEYAASLQILFQFDYECLNEVLFIGCQRLADVILYVLNGFLQWWESDIVIFVIEPLQSHNGLIAGVPIIPTPAHVAAAVSYVHGNSVYMDTIPQSDRAIEGYHIIHIISICGQGPKLPIMLHRPHLVQA